MSPISFIFEKFPVVILRLLRLLRVFRLAKSLPRLRSIVEALMSGFSAVGWVVIFIVIFNYIAACMLMLIFQRSDPFHFGSVSRSMFNVMRMETLDSCESQLLCHFLFCSFVSKSNTLVLHNDHLTWLIDRYCRGCNPANKRERLRYGTELRLSA